METRHLEEVLARPRNRPAAEVSRVRTRFRKMWSSHRRRQETVDAAYTVLHPGNYGPLLPSGRDTTAA
jgi:hypothetical protein